MVFHCETKFQNSFHYNTCNIKMYKLKCFISIKTSHLLVSRCISCVVHIANLQSILIKHLRSGIEEFPVLWCSTVYKNTFGGRGGDAIGIVK